MGHLEKLEVLYRLTLSTAFVIREHVVVIFLPSGHIDILLSFLYDDSLAFLFACICRTIFVLRLSWSSFLDFNGQLILN